jgi:hypothetical protein
MQGETPYVSRSQPRAVGSGPKLGGNCHGRCQTIQAGPWALGLRHSCVGGADTKASLEAGSPTPTRPEDERGARQGVAPVELRPNRQSWARATAPALAVGDAQAVGATKNASALRSTATITGRCVPNRNERMKLGDEQVPARPLVKAIHDSCQRPFEELAIAMNKQSAPYASGTLSCPLRDR